MNTDQNDLPPSATLYVNRAVEFADLDSARAYLTKVGEGYYLCAGVELAYRVLPKYPGFDLPGRDAIHTSGDEAAATLELHAAQLAKRGANGMAYDLRVAAALIRHLDPDRGPQNNLDWNVDHSSDEGLAAFCPACGSSKVKTHPNVWGALHCDECGCYGEARS